MAEQNAHINYSVEDIERYLEGKMSAKEMHDMEKAALQDSFLAEAIEGYTNASFEKSHQHLNEITAALQKQKEETKIVALSSKNFYWRRIAAMIILVVGIGGLGWYIINTSNSVKRNEVAQVKENKKSDTNEVAKPSMSEVEKNDTSNKLIAQNSSAKPLQKEKAEHVQKREEVSTKALTKIYPEETTFRKTDSDSLKVEDNITASISSINDGRRDSLQQERQAPQGFAQNKPKNALDEVVTSNYGIKKFSKRNTNADSAYPEGGWESFNAYVYKKLNKPFDSTRSPEITGDVQLEFSIDENGEPYDFSVLKPANDSITSKAIEIIKDGPKWIATGKEKKGRATIKF